MHDRTRVSCNPNNQSIPLKTAVSSIYVYVRKKFVFVPHEQSHRSHVNCIESSCPSLSMSNQENRRNGRGSTCYFPAQIYTPYHHVNTERLPVSRRRHFNDAFNRPIRHACPQHYGRLLQAVHRPFRFRQRSILSMFRIYLVRNKVC